MSAHLAHVVAHVAQAAASVADPSAPSQAQGVLDFVSPFLNVGLVGVILLMVVLRKGFVPEWVLREAELRHARELAAKDADIAELKKSLREGTDLYNSQVIPAFIRSIDTNKEYNELLRRLPQQVRSREGEADDR